MKKAIKDWWYYNSELVWFPLTIITGFALLLGVATLAQANQYKFNCNLDHRPDLYTALLIDDSTYAYNPQLFCSTLKEKMHK